MKRNPYSYRTYPTHTVDAAARYLNPSTAKYEAYQQRIYREASRRVDESLRTTHLWTIKEDLKSDARERQLLSSDTLGISSDELDTRDKMLDIVRQMRREEKAFEVRMMEEPRGRKRGMWCVFTARKTAEEQRVRGLERIAAARVYQAVEIEGYNKEVYEQGICEERRRLWFWGIREGPKFEIIDLMLEFLAGKRRILDHYLHDWAMAWLSRGLAGVFGDEKKLEEVYERRRDKLRFKGREDDEEFEILSIMLAMIKVVRR
jgi:hypothetical protein